MQEAIREARDSDVESIRGLFVEAYGHEYPFKGFYDTEWLKKSVYDDGTLVLVMEADGRIIKHDLWKQTFKKFFNFTSTSYVQGGMYG